jgi:diaminopropionate ammonia-lyase
MSDYFLQTPSDHIEVSSTTQILEFSDSLLFHQTIPSYSKSSLITLEGLAEKLNLGSIHLKNESERFGLNAFKGLGASYAIYKILEENPKIVGFCTATDGNHGRAVAWASRMAGKKAEIYMPIGTAEQRVQAIRNEGANVIVTDVHYDETCLLAAEAIIKNGLILVQDTAWDTYEEIPAWIMAGYLTQLKEMEDSINTLPNPGVDIVFLQVGVGSWAAAVAWYYVNRYGKNRPKLVLVESKEADGFQESFKQGHRTVPIGNFETIMAGLNCGIPSTSAWEILKNSIDVCVRIDDQYAEKAIRSLYLENGSDPQIIGGESGVSGLAGLMAILEEENMIEVIEHLGLNITSRILVFLTEGATDQVNFDKIINKK